MSMTTLKYTLDLSESSTIALCVADAKSGNVDAFESLHQACRNLICSIALAITKDVHASEDITQQVFINAWQNLDKLQNNHSFLPWIRQTARYKALNSIRDKKIQYVESDPTTFIKFEQLLAENHSLDTDLLKKEQIRLMNQLVAALPEESREILTLYYREDQSTKHVAIFLGISEEKVRQHLSRCRKKLKQQYLSRFGMLATSTLSPALALGLIAPSAPVAAATLASKATYGSSISKLFALLGGAFIGALAAMVSTYYSCALAIKFTNCKTSKEKLKVYRTRMMWFSLVFSISFVTSYSFTSGWIMPTIIFAGFTVVFGWHFFKLQHISLNNHDSQINARNTQLPLMCRNPKLQKWLGRLGFFIGFSSGWFGLIIGLINSDRLIL